MAQADRVKWNQKHQESKIDAEPLELITRYSKLCRGDKALDIACGLGRHSRYLAQNGFSVDAVDISDKAIDSLKDIANIYPKAVDLEGYALPKNHYDLIICTYFLDREIVAQIYDALKPNGLVIMETFVAHKENERKASNEAFLLKEGEINHLFARPYEAIYLKEMWGKDYLGNKAMLAKVIATKRAL